MSSPKRSEIESEINGRNKEITDLRERLMAAELHRHEDAAANEGLNPNR